MYIWPDTVGWTRHQQSLVNHNIELGIFLVMTSGRGVRKRAVGKSTHINTCSTTHDMDGRTVVWLVCRLIRHSLRCCSLVHIFDLCWSGVVQIHVDVLFERPSPQLAPASVHLHPNVCICALSSCLCFGVFVGCRNKLIVIINWMGQALQRSLAHRALCIFQQHDVLGFLFKWTE